MTFNETEVIELIKANDKKPKWVIEAREIHESLKALVTGEGFADELVNKIEKIESADRAEARKKYSKDIRAMFHRIMMKRDNVFEANGGSEQFMITNETVLGLFNHFASNFKSNKSIFKYLSEYYFSLLDVDPNGLIMLEYTAKKKSSKVLNKKPEDFELYPAYKSICDIRNYEDNGQMLEYVIFEPTKKEESSNEIWRVVDDLTDWTVINIGGIYIIDVERTFQHPFGKVPAIILSDREKVGTKIRLSPVNPIVPESEEYARDKSILTIYKFLHGFPYHWRFGSQCVKCKGVGKVGNDVCPTCSGKGDLRKGDVTDLNILPLPGPNQIIPKEMGGYFSPDLKTWKQYKEDLRDSESLMDDTIWGTKKIDNKDKTDNRTATAEYIDVQPIMNRLNSYADLIQYVHNTFAHLIFNFVDPVKNRDETLYAITYGRRYIIESPDVILEKYQNSKKNGDNNTILDKSLEEYVLSKYKTDPYMQDVMLKKIKVEPYVHQTVDQIKAIFGEKEAARKILFQKFWETVDITKKPEQILTEFEKFYTNESSKINFVEGQTL